MSKNKINKMRKFTFAALTAGLILTACDKAEDTRVISTTQQTRTFTYAMDGGSMYRTRSVETSYVLNAIESALPAKVSIYLTSQTTSKIYQGKTDEPIVLPTDEYHVIGSYDAPMVGGMLQGTSGYLTHAPKIDIAQDISVTDDVTAYTLQGTYKSFAIVVDAEETESVYITGASGKEEEVTFLTSGTSKIAFVQGNYSTNYLKLRVVPTDTERFSEAEYTIATKQGTNLVYAEYGKFYVFHPKVEGEEPKVIGLDLPTFARVDVEYDY